MTSQNNAATSRLAQMQVKFQQKQLQQRKLQKEKNTFEPQKRKEGGEDLEAKTFGNGRVRQMFDERRRGAGIDRSNPLKPIVTASRSSTMNSVHTVLGKSSNVSAADGKHAALGRNVSNGRSKMMRSDTFDRLSTKEAFNSRVNVVAPDARFSKTFSCLSLKNKRSSPSRMMSSSSSNVSRIQSSNSIKLKPVITKKSPLALRNNQSSSHSLSSPRKVETQVMKKQTMSRSPIRKISAQRTVSRTSAHSQKNTPPAGMVLCKFCQRSFIEERLAKHEEVCERVINSKRKVYDASKARVKGTDAEKYLKKSSKIGSYNRPTNAAARSGTSAKPAPSKSNWRKAHEDFISTIREAKKVQMHVARGGKLSDLPPPPPTENPDYIQCPHCLRRFNAAAADRHIPKCANMLHNKPKPINGNNKWRK